MGRKSKYTILKIRVSNKYEIRSFRYKMIHHQQTYLGDLRQPSVQNIGCMLKVTSRELVGIWLDGPLQTLLVSNQQCGQSPPADGKTPHAYTASSYSLINLSPYPTHLCFCKISVSEGPQKLQKMLWECWVEFTSHTWCTSILLFHTVLNSKKVQIRWSWLGAQEPQTKAIEAQRIVSIEVQNAFRNMLLKVGSSWIRTATHNIRHANKYWMLQIHV